MTSVRQRVKGHGCRVASELVTDFGFAIKRSRELLTRVVERQNWAQMIFGVYILAARSLFYTPLHR